MAEWPSGYPYGQKLHSQLNAASVPNGSSPSTSGWSSLLAPDVSLATSHHPNCLSSQSFNCSLPPSYNVSSVCLIPLPDPKAASTTTNLCLTSSSGSPGSYPSHPSEQIQCHNEPCSPSSVNDVPPDLSVMLSTYCTLLPSNNTSLAPHESLARLSACPPVTWSDSPSSQNQAVHTDPPIPECPAATHCPHAFLRGGSVVSITLHKEHMDNSRCKICNTSVDKMAQMDQNRRFYEQFLDSLSRFEDWLQLVRITSSLSPPARTLHQEAKVTMSRYEGLLREMRERLLDLESLNRQYWRLSQVPHQNLIPSVLRSRMQEINQLWDVLQGQAEAIHQTLKLRVQQRDEFDMNQEEIRLWLTEMDQGLSTVEYIHSGNPSEKIRQLQTFQEDVRSNMQRMEDLFERGNDLINESDPQDADKLEEEIAALGYFCQEIFTHLSRLQKRLVSTKLVFEDDFLDGDLEMGSSGSSDVFLEIGGEQRAGVGHSVVSSASQKSPHMDGAAVGTFEVELEWDPLGDVGRSSSNDEQESFYTASSVPRTYLRTRESHSSFNSLPWAAQGDGDTWRGSRDSVVPAVFPHFLDDESRALVLDPRPLQVNCNYFRGKAEQQGLTSTSSFAQSGQNEFDFQPMTDTVAAACGHEMNVTRWNESSDPAIINNEFPPEQRQRHGKKKRLKRLTHTENWKMFQKPHVPEVSILMENGYTQCPSDFGRGSSGSLCTWMKCLMSLSVVFLVLVASLFILPMNRDGCGSRRLAWTLMLTYVNGPPPT
uniref:KASH domain-containing protein n=1 Tax=Leptobrachium leishanense TaxID=445787 RepID=A0A8C5PW32_9ANUR